MTYLRNKRRNRGMKLTEVARYIGISAPYLYDIELGRRNGNVELLEKIEEALERECVTDGSSCICRPKVIKVKSL